MMSFLGVTATNVRSPNMIYMFYQLVRELEGHTYEKVFVQQPFRPMLAVPISNYLLVDPVA